MDAMRRRVPAVGPTGRPAANGAGPVLETAYDLLAAQPFLTGLSDAHVRQLSYMASRTVLPAGSRVFSEGGRADRFWLINRGRVDLDVYVPGRGGVVVESLGAGAVLGWSWLFPPYRWHFGARAVETTFGLKLDAFGVRRLCDADHELGYQLIRRFMQVVVERLQSTRLRLLDPDVVPVGDLDASVRTSVTGGSPRPGSTRG